MTKARVSVDVDEVIAVAAFYRKSAQVLGTAASDLGDHRFGTWVPGDDHGDLAGRFIAMSDALTARLQDQAASASALSDALARGVEQVRTADEDAGSPLRTLGAACGGGDG